MGTRYYKDKGALHGLCLLAALTVGWVRPELPTQAKAPPADGQKLDYMIVVVNGEPRLVHDGEELSIVRGDTVMVKEALLVDPTAKIRNVDVVGVQSTKPREDRGYAFTTSELKPHHSENGKGEVYAVTATTQKTLHGAVYLRLIDAELRYAEVSINGAVKVLRDGEPLTVSANDKIKVERVVTNLANADGVLFHISEDGGKGQYAIRFSRGGTVFASIPLRITD